MAEETQSDRAIKEIKRRRHRGGPDPHIDLTQHKLEDGTIVSTQANRHKGLFLQPLTRVYICLLMEERIACACFARMHLQVPAPATNIPTDEQFFSKTKKGMPDIAYLKDHFYRAGRIKEEHALYIIEKATEILHTEPNLLDVDAPVIGQFVYHPLPVIMACVPYDSVSY